MKLQVILGSTRPTRMTERLAKWVVSEAQKLPDTQVELVDLQDYPMPMLDEPVSPRYSQDRHINEQAGRWVSKIAEGDAYIFVTPEYNHSIPGVLKNALDYLTFELVHKPATVVSHGSVGGARATMHLKEILSESRAAVVPFQVAFTGRVGESMDENGVLKPELAAAEHGPAAVLANALQDLKWYSDALAAARQ
jgi:NAD(P)H-dependent FMN reductase